ncbi:MAG: patatin-like phospholipase family protein [Bacteroidia bacterium]
MLLVIFWLLFFGIITNNIATRYGVAYLFLGPEYFNKLSVISYFIVGFSCGGFIMAYNISSFMKNAFRFPFLASLRYPFLKYCLNNFIIPFIFITLYCVQIFLFLKAEDCMSMPKAFLMILSFISGIMFFLFVAFSYFFRMNKDIFKLYGIQLQSETSLKLRPQKNTGERNPRLIKEARDWYVETYLSTPIKMRLVRSVQHYKKEMLKDVIKKNHHAAFIFQIATIVSLLGLGFFSKIDAFQIPAAASMFLLFSMFLMLFSSFYRWFRSWSTVVFIFFLLAFNYLHKIEFLRTENYAYGLNYDMPKAEYSYDNFKIMDKQYSNLNKDIDATLQILNKWKIKNASFSDPNKKPKMVFINVSGGGLRSSLWTLSTLQYVDSLLGGKLLSQTQLITGSSGGMVGAAYLRELYLEKQRHEITSYYSKEYQTNISKDVLNPIAFKVATSEWLFPMQSFIVDNHRYSEDRGSAFEQKLEENINYAFDNKRLNDYQLPEANAIVPMIVFSPSIVNDGRKMLISPQGISYLTMNAKTDKTTYNKLFDAIEYSRFFREQGAKNTMFTSVLRMSATFPYISPVVSLPSEPRIEIMDAGLRDNYGLETSLRFIKAFNDWIAQNTTGIVIIQLRDKHKNIPIDDNPAQTLAQALTRPMGSFYGHLFEVQDYNQNQQIQMADLWCKSQVDIIDLELRNELNDRISLSWHLTNKEKIKVHASLNLPENQEAIKRLVKLLK